MGLAECYYDILNVPRTATDADIRTAYRRAALATHPDKNPGDASADARFQALGNAYSVLSDPHERAWYDDHREEILRGDEPGEGASAGGDDDDGRGGRGSARARNRRSSTLDLYRYFSSSAYTPATFHTVFSSVFDTLATEERDAPNPPPREVLPPFGTRGSGHAVTRAFYAAWAHFASAKTFAHADAWNPATAPSRDVRRAMEKENRVRRSEARTAFNALVRSLVGYVRRRDVRVGEAERAADEAAAAVNAARAREVAESVARRKAASRAAAAAMAAEEMDAGLAELVAATRREQEEEAAAAAASAAAAGGAGEGGEGGGVGGAGGDQDWWCEACAKRFRSDSQWRNHERSKKHRAVVARWRRQALAEERAFQQLSVDDKDSDKDNDGVGTGTGDEQAAASAGDTSSDDGGGGGSGLAHRHASASGVEAAAAGRVAGGLDGTTAAASDEDAEVSVSNGTADAANNVGESKAGNAAPDDGSLSSSSSSTASAEGVLRAMARGRAKRARKAAAKRQSAAATAASGVLHHGPPRIASSAGAAGADGDESPAVDSSDSDGVGDDDAFPLGDKTAAATVATAADALTDAAVGGGGAPPPTDAVDSLGKAAAASGRRQKKGRRSKQGLPPPRAAAAPSGTGDADADRGGREGAWRCNVCAATYETRNRLFRHVKENGHALAVPQPPPADVAAGGGGRRRRRAANGGTR